MNKSLIFALRNYKFALFAALFFGSIAPLTKLLGTSLPPLTLAGLLYFGAGFGLLLIMLLQRSLFRHLKSVERTDIKWFAMATFFGGILGPVFLTYGLIKISGTSASLLLNLEAILTSLIAWFIFKEHFEKRIVWGMLFIIAGCLILSINATSTSGLDTIEGVFLISLACLSWGVDNNVTRKISHLNPLFSASLKGIIAGVANLTLASSFENSLAFNVSTVSTLILGFFGIGVSLVSFIKSLGLIGTARTGAVFSIAPFIGAFLSIFILQESISLALFSSSLLMAIGVWFHLSENHNHEHTHEEISHSHEHTHDEHHEHTHIESLTTEASPLRHTHLHTHSSIKHKHQHFPDIHHRHTH